MTLPSGFIDMARSLLKEEAQEFLEAMQRPPITSVRLNSRKPGAQFPEGTPVKWCPTGYYLPVRPQFTLDPLLHAGAYYVQDASSMIHREVVRRLVSGPVSLLDLCAAPGGKTTAMIDALSDGSRVVANEYIARRAAILKENLTKWGYPLATVTNRDSAYFAESGDKFDIVAVDAPCSGEGMMRKDEEAVAQWSTQLIEKCAQLQKEIVSNAEKALKPGGFLIYSTCTFNRMENEEVAEYINTSLGLQPVDMQFPVEWGIPRGIDTDLPVYRFMPHRTEGEGLFLAVFRKPVTEESGEKETSQTNVLSPKKNYAKKNNVKSKGSDVIVPEIEEVLSVNFNRDLYPEADVDKNTALSYLRREAIKLSSDIPKGPVVITYKGLPLGMAKNIGQRANNLYPKSWRILMR